MKKLLIALLTLGSVSIFAQDSISTLRAKEVILENFVRYNDCEQEYNYNETCEKTKAVLLRIISKHSRINSIDKLLSELKVETRAATGMVKANLAFIVDDIFTRDFTGEFLE